MDHTDNPPLLIELGPEQAAKAWPVIAHTVKRAVSNAGQVISEAEYNRALESVLKGTTQCLCYVAEKKLRVIFLVRVLRDDISEQTDLLIFTASSINPMHLDLWQDCGRKMIEHAKLAGCKNIVAVSRNPHILKIWNSLGGSTERRFCVLEVK